MAKKEELKEEVKDPVLVAKLEIYQKEDGSYLVNKTTHENGSLLDHPQGEHADELKLLMAIEDIIVNA